MIQLTAAHWVYLLFVLIVLLTMILRKETPLVCVIGAFVLALVVTGSLIGAVQAVFNAVVVAAQELLGVVTIISIIVALAKMMEENGLADMMFAPVRRRLKSAVAAWWIMGAVVMIVSWFIWPSPAIALVGALLLPAAIEVGLPPISAAVAISMFGYGIALTTDFVIQGAPSITAKAAGVGVTEVMWGSLPLVAVWAVIALPLSFRAVRKDIQAHKGEAIEWEPFEMSEIEKAETARWQAARPGFKKFALVLIFAVMILDLAAMLIFKIRGGDATALLGGTIALLMVVIALGVYGGEGMEKLTEHGRSGFMFGIRIFTPVFFIAAFFFMGAPGTAKAIFGEGARGLLFDLGQALADAVPLGRIPTALVEAVVGGITGLDGSGFSGLPLAGTMAQALGGATSLDPARLAALGQFFAVAIGGGCIVPWAVIPAAAITATNPIEVAGRNLVPTLVGLAGVLVVSILLI